MQTDEEDLPYGEKFVAKESGEQKVYYNRFNRDYDKKADSGIRTKIGAYKSINEEKRIGFTIP